MLYYSTNRKSPPVSLREAVLAGLAPDNGLYLPERIPTLPSGFLDTISQKSFQEICCEIFSCLHSEDLPPEVLERVVREYLEQRSEEADNPLRVEAGKVSA